MSELAARNSVITARIALTDDPKRRANRGGHFNRDSYVIAATIKSIRTAVTRQTVDVPVTVFAAGNVWKDFLPSQQLEVTGRLAEPTPGELVAAILLVRGTPKVLSRPSELQTAAGALRSGLRAAADTLPPDQRGLLPGLVVGDVSRMDPQVASDLRESGLNHLHAVSGANLAIVAGAALALSRLVGLSLPARAIFAAVAMLAFAVVARPSPSVLRALLMGLAAAVALGTGRARDGFAALSTTVLFLVLFVPELARSYGFALSVAATAGILILAPRWRDHLSAQNPRNTEDAQDAQDVRSTRDVRSARDTQGARDTRDAEVPGVPGMPGASRNTWDVGGMRDARGVQDARDAHDVRSTQGVRGTRDAEDTQGAQNAQGLKSTQDAHGARNISDVRHPNGGHREGDGRWRAGGPSRESLQGGASKMRWRLPRWVAEAVAVPAAAQVAVTPVLVLMVGQLTPVAVLANLLVAPAVAPATLLGFGAALVAPVWPDGARLLVVPAGYAVGWIITIARWAVNVPFATLPWPRGLPGLGLLALAVAIAIPILRRRAWRAMALTAAGATLVAVLVIRPIAGPWPPKGWLMVMCDVGQGDGLIIAAGPGRGVVVDTGPDPVVMDRCLRRVGVDEVPLLVLTHPHADHVDGLPGVLRNRRVGAAVVSPLSSAPQRGVRAGERVSATLARHRIPKWVAVPGTRWRFGPSELTILAPEPALGETHGYGEGSAINNSSVVIHVRWRSGSALLGGDLETEAQEQLLRRMHVRADILKTPHHGSNRQSPEFLSSLGIRAALISSGDDNDYGHPAPTTLALLRRLGAGIYRTDKSGDLAVVERDGGMAVVPRGP